MVIDETGGGSAELVGESLDAAIGDWSNACLAALRKDFLDVLKVAYSVSIFSLPTHMSVCRGPGCK